MRVWITTDNRWVPGRVISTADTTPCSYLVDTSTDILCRHCSDLNAIPNYHNADEEILEVPSKHEQGLAPDQAI